MLASTVQFSKNGRPHIHTRTHPHKGSFTEDMARTATSPHTLETRMQGQMAVKKLPLPQDPTARHTKPPTTRPARSTPTHKGIRSTRHHPAANSPSKSAFHASEQPSGMNIRKRHTLLRKEVIQPHLPVRLPCYDFVLIAGPTFDGSLHKGWATGFGCYRLS